MKADHKNFNFFVFALSLTKRVSCSLPISSSPKWPSPFSKSRML